MSRFQKMRLHFSDGTNLEVAENDPLQVLQSDPGPTQEPGWHRINGEATPPLFGKLANVRAVALSPGQKVVTYRGVMTIESVKRG